jgi:hypothetical protein
MDKQVAIQQHVTKPFLLRVAGLPVDVVERLRFTETAAWAASVLECERSLHEQKDGVADALGAAVPRYPDDRSLRRRLINLRRAVFNLREAAYGTEGRALAAQLDSPERERLLAWIDHWEAYTRLLHAGQELYTRELRQKRICLKEMAMLEDFRKGLALASPLLERALDAYVEADELDLKHTQRAVERSLVEYLVRAAWKTSPFSTFTAVCHGRFDEQATGNDPDVIQQMESLDKQSFTQLNIITLSRLSAALLASPQIRSELPVSMTPGWHIVDGRIRYLRRMQDMEDESGKATFTLDLLHENVFYLPIGPLLQMLIQLLGSGQTLRFGELVTRLTGLAGEQTLASQEQVSAYLAQLLRLGLLIVPDLQLDLHSSNPLKAYLQHLLALQIPALASIVAHLETVDMLVQAYATAQAVQRRALLTAIGQELRACYSATGQDTLALPKTLLYEDTTLRPHRLAINQTGWQEILSSAAEFQCLLPLFDLNLPRRLVTEGYFLARYGAGQQCDDFLTFAYEFRQRFFGHYLKNTWIAPDLPANAQATPFSVNYFQQTSITQLARAQQALSAYMSQAYSQLQGEELVLGDAFREALVAYVPQGVSRLSSYTCFSQFARINGEPRLVVNRVTTGLTLMFSRFGHFFADEAEPGLIEELRLALQQCQPPGAVFAELQGGYTTTNLNIHPPITPYELVCPGESSTRADEEQIPLSDLAVCHDAAEGRLLLYSKRLHKEVIPLYLGFLLPMLLPELQQVLLNFAIAPRCPLNLWKGVTVAADGRGVQGYPRVRYKQLILQRAHWKFPPGALPQRSSGQADADFFLAVARWRQQYHLPSAVFITPARTGEIAAASHIMPGKHEPLENVYTYKPLYVDLANYFSLALLEATIRNCVHGIVVTEVWPSHEHLWLQHKQQSYVSEFVWEINSLQQEEHHG